MFGCARYESAQQLLTWVVKRALYPVKFFPTSEITPGNVPDNGVELFSCRDGTKNIACPDLDDMLDPLPQDIFFGVAHRMWININGQNLFSAL